MANPQAVKGFQAINGLRDRLHNHHNDAEGVVAKFKNAGAYFGCRAVAAISLVTNVFSGIVAAVGTAALFVVSLTGKCTESYGSAKAAFKGSFTQEIESLKVLNPIANVKLVWSSVFGKKTDTEEV